jgi:hypothetical protein
LSETVRKSLGAALDLWASEIDADVALVGLSGEVLTMVDLARARAFVTVENGSMEIPICHSRLAGFSSGLLGLRSGDDDWEVGGLRAILSGLACRGRRSICVCLLASSLGEDPEFEELLKDSNVAVNFFTRKSDGVPSYARFFSQIRVFADDECQFVAPTVKAFLDSGFLFCVRITFAHPACVSETVALATARYLRSSAIDLPLLTGQSSVMFTAPFARVQSGAPLVFQFCVEGICPDGRRLLRVLSYTVRSVPTIDTFDGVTFACLIARRLALACFFDVECNLRELCLDLVSAWSAEGHYMRWIPEIFRDVPVLLWAIGVSDLFRKCVSKIEELAAMIAFMGLPVEEMRRLLYPVMLIPPFTFAHRLTESSVRNAKVVILASAFKGIALVRDGSGEEEVAKWARSFGIPIGVFDEKAKMDEFLVEQKAESFAEFAECIEVEVNGRRF